MTKKAKIIWTVIGLVVLTPPVGLFLFDKKLDADIKSELAISKKLGFAISGDDYREALTPAKPEENAAEFYRRAQGEKSADISILNDLLKDPSEANLVAAKKLLAQHKDGLLRAADQAVIRPRCWFDRPWEDGLAVLFAEYAKMKNMAQLLAIRGTVASSEDRVEDALSDFRAINQIATHAEEEPSAIPVIVGQAVRVIGVRSLVAWDMQKPNPGYVNQLDEAVKAWPEPDMRKGYALELYWTTDMLKQGSTEEGRKKLGLPESEVSPMEGKIPVPLQKSAMVKIIRAYRKPLELKSNDVWEIQRAYMDANEEIATNSLTFPTGAKIMYSLSPGDAFSSEGSPFLLPLIARTNKIAYTAIARALHTTPLPKRIDVSDLQSPYDGSPIMYEYDGKRITITVSTPGTSSPERIISIPPRERN